MICVSCQVLLARPGIGGSRGTYVGEQNCAQCFGGEACRKVTAWETKA